MAIDSLQQGEFNQFTHYLLLFAILIPLLQGMRYLNRYLYEWLQQRIIFGIRRHLYAHLFSLSIPFLEKSTKGDLLTRLGQDIIRISGLLVMIPSLLFSHSLTFITYLGILFYIDYRLAIITSLLLPVFILHQRFFSNRTKPAAREFLNRQGKMTGFEEETLRNMQGILSFTAEPAMLSRFDKKFSAFRVSAMRHLLLQNGFMISFELLAALSALLIISIGIFAIEAQRITAGELVNFLLYLGYLVVPLRGLSNIPVDSQVRIAAAERVAEILDIDPLINPDGINSPGTASKADQLQGSIRFKDVSFSYDKSKPVLTDFNLQIEPGEFIALVGPSGAGKSTIAKLLLRLYDPVSGQICIDGQDLKQLNLSVLRSHIAIVWQQAFLLDETLCNNLRLARPDASEEEISNALHIAHASEFVEQLPGGIHCRLGSGGVSLSAGQAQRIALAQAFLRQSPIMILDEATSALDSQSEQAIQQAYAELHGQRTMLVIAHRYSTITGADRIIYLNGDGTVSIGTHHELLDQHEHYRHASTHQSVLPGSI